MISKYLSQPSMLQSLKHKRRSILRSDPGRNRSSTTMNKLQTSFNCPDLQQNPKTKNRVHSNRYQYSMNCMSHLRAQHCFLRLRRMQVKKSMINIDLVMDDLQARPRTQNVHLLKRGSQGDALLVVVSLKGIILESGQHGQKKRLTNWSKVLQSMGWADGKASLITRNYNSVKEEQTWI